MSKVVDFVKNTSWVQFLIVLIVGVAIGALFYPTKHIVETERQKHEEETKILKEQHSKELSQVHETLDKTTQSYAEFRKESDHKISTLTTENVTLKSNVKTSYYKIVKPDGTIEIKKFSETQVDESKQVITSIQEEFKEKVASIETKWETIHKDRVATLSKQFDLKEAEYKHRIDEFEKSKVTDINKKSFGVEAGILTDLTYYGHITYDIFGPIFLGLQSQFGTSTGAGVGLGLRF